MRIMSFRRCSLQRALTLCGLAALALTLTAAGAAAQTVDEIVAKNLAAKGGVAALKAVRAMRISATVKPTPEIEIPVTITTARPNKLKQESSVQGQQIIMAFDGTTAWSVNPLMGADTPRPIEGPELDSLRSQADMDGPLVDYKIKGTTVELVGTETVEGKKANKLKITRKDGQSQELFLDADTGLEVKAINQIVRQGQNLTVESYFSDYRPVSGLTIAHTIKQKMMGQDVAFTINKVEILPDVDDAIFKMPGK
jgi:outer membrane lipoprotein-sorting protein